MSTIRVLLCDDHLLVRASLKSLLAEFTGIEVVGEADDGRAALDQISKRQPNVVIMDISMPGLNGIEATRRVVKEYAQVRVVILSMHADESHVLQALRAGASAYVLKGAAPRELEMAIQAVMRGEIFLSPGISKLVLGAYLSGQNGQTNSLDLLTPRQREILQLIAEGKSSKQIAQLLSASAKTIESHRASLMDRLDIHDIAGLVRYAVRQGLVSPEK